MSDECTKLPFLNSRFLCLISFIIFWKKISVMLRIDSESRKLEDNMLVQVKDDNDLDSGRSHQVKNDLIENIS